MLTRKIITIDEEKCNGCGLCVEACHEGAIAMVNGKARLIKEDYCDGLGDCLPVCPCEAISFIEKAVPSEPAQAKQAPQQACSCPSSSLRVFKQTEKAQPAAQQAQEMPSALAQWPVQIKLVPAHAPFFADAELLVAADCTAFAYAAFHQLMKGKITLIGCPKLDDIDYSEKLAAIIAAHDIAGLTVARMEVPCCGGLAAAVQKAVDSSGKDIPVETIIISVDGTVIKRYGGKDGQIDQKHANDNSPAFGG